MKKGDGLLLRVARAFNPIRRISARVRLSRAKHRSLQGHPRMALRISRWLAAYHYSEGIFFSSDSAPPDVVKKRQEGFRKLSVLLQQRSPDTLALTEKLESTISDLAFVNTHRVPFQYQKLVQQHLKIG